MRTESVPLCPACGSVRREVLYAGLEDSLFDAPGEWTLKRCCRCGTAFLDPRPTFADVGKAYATYYTHSGISSNQRRSLARRLYEMAKAGYLSSRWGYSRGVSLRQKLLSPLLYLHPGARVVTDFSIMCLSALPNGRVLDVGCGSGALVERLGNLGWHAEGVDLDEQAIRAARTSNLTVRLGTLEEQRYLDGGFDAVTMSHVIEHVHDPLQLLRECRRILKPGGRLVVVTPNISSLGHRYFGASWLGLDPPRHLHIFTPSSLAELAKGAGFRNVNVKTTVRGADGLYVASRDIQRTGRHKLGSRQPLSIRLQAQGMQFLEWAALRVMSDAGGEIALIGEK